ncbi:MAG TPA: mevalonate kinase [Polyangia bacterium]|jgi:mevalonate kinase
MSRSGFGRGKVILLGEHAVVYGQPALAGALRRGVRAEARPGPARLEVPAWGLQASPGGPGAADRAFAAILDATGASAAVQAEAEIPARAGLGSSAALAAAVARALCDDAARVAAAVAAAEGVFHGNPSGLDAALALDGGLGVFTRDAGLRPLAAAPVTWCVGDTGQPRDTRALVAAVGARVAAERAAAVLVERLGALATAGAAALVAGDLGALGRCLDDAQEALAALGVSSPAIERMGAVARGAGALGAKLTGAGGGGCVIALAPGREAEVLAAWRDAGYAGFAAEVGG